MRRARRRHPPSRRRVTTDPSCPYCHRHYSSRLSCTIDNNTAAFGQEDHADEFAINPDRDPTLDPADVVCRDCNVAWGGHHHVNCCVASCATCGGQALGHTLAECDANQAR